MQKTTNYNLNQWEAGDAIRRADFNADNAAIDQALAEIGATVTELAGRRIATGTFQGNDSTLTVELGFTPAVVFLSSDEITGLSVHMAIPEQPLTCDTNVVEIIDNGFRITACGNQSFNASYNRYMYLALRL